MTTLSPHFINLLDLVERKERQVMQAKEVQTIIARAWDAGLCPVCAGTNTKETSYHDASGQSKYKCLDCGAKGHGLDCL